MGGVGGGGGRMGENPMSPIHFKTKIQHAQLTKALFSHGELYFGE